MVKTKRRAEYNIIWVDDGLGLLRCDVRINVPMNGRPGSWLVAFIVVASAHIVFPA
jgi:hypothetical protein